MTLPLVFTDLDGTLLDHHTYSYSAALPAIKRLSEAGIPLMLNSSKTKAEMLALRTELGNQHPFVTENGGAVFYPKGYFKDGPSDGPLECHTSGVPRSEILRLIHDLREQQAFNFTGFADMDAASCAAHTGLPEDKAALALQRSAGEPLLWQDSESRLADFEALLRPHRLKLLQGGRFTHVTGDYDKGAGVRYLQERFQQRDGKRTSIALGDSPNDAAMLMAVDIAVIIPRAKGDPLELAHHARAIHATKPGPEGWQEVMEQLIDECLA